MDDLSGINYHFAFFIYSSNSQSKLDFSFPASPFFTQYWSSSLSSCAASSFLPPFFTCLSCFFGARVNLAFLVNLLASFLLIAWLTCLIKSLFTYNRIVLPLTGGFFWMSLRLTTMAFLLGMAGLLVTVLWRVCLTCFPDPCCLSECFLWRTSCLIGFWFFVSL
jgi:hypothetical protein